MRSGVVDVTGLKLSELPRETSFRAPVERNMGAVHDCLARRAFARRPGSGRSVSRYALQPAARVGGCVEAPRSTDNRR